MVGFTPNRNGEANTLSPKTDSPFVRTLATKLKPMRPVLSKDSTKLAIAGAGHMAEGALATRNEIFFRRTEDDLDLINNEALVAQNCRGGLDPASACSSNGDASPLASERLSCRRGLRVRRKPPFEELSVPLFPENFSFLGDDFAT
jgi:hypothetical protein